MYNLMDGYYVPIFKKSYLVSNAGLVSDNISYHDHSLYLYPSSTINFSLGRQRCLLVISSHHGACYDGLLSMIAAVTLSTLLFA